MLFRPDQWFEPPQVTVYFYLLMIRVFSALDFMHLVACLLHCIILPLTVAQYGSCTVRVPLNLSINHQNTYRERIRGEPFPVVHSSE